jgi:hypothetical protein
MAASIALLALSSGCATNQGGPRELYRWGVYEDLLYDAALKPGAADPVSASQRLSADIATTEISGREVAPGLHAHLGYLYYTQGNLGAATLQFERERELFPESTVFIDGLLARLAADQAGSEDDEVTSSETSEGAPQ